MTDERKIDEEYLTRISGGTAQEIAELKEAILANPFLAGEWDETVGWAKRMCKPDDDITVAGLLLEDRFSFVRELSNDKPNEYQFTSWHEDIVRLIRNYHPNTD